MNVGVKRDIMEMELNYVSLLMNVSKVFMIVMKCGLFVLIQKRVFVVNVIMVLKVMGVYVMILMNVIVEIMIV